MYTYYFLIKICSETLYYKVHVQKYKQFVYKIIGRDYTLSQSIDREIQHRPDTILPSANTGFRKENK